MPKGIETWVKPLSILKLGSKATMRVPVLHLVSLDNNIRQRRGWLLLGWVVFNSMICALHALKTSDSLEKVENIVPGLNSIRLSLSPHNYWPNVLYLTNQSTRVIVIRIGFSLFAISLFNLHHSSILSVKKCERHHEFVHNT